MMKPDCVGRGLIGECIARFERRGLKLVGIKMQVLTRERAERHYEEHAGKVFYEPLLDFITSGPTVQMVWQGLDAVAQVRKMNGATNCLQADVGTIRGDFGLSQRKNLIHASDTPETAVREIALYFRPEELLDYELPFEEWRC